MTNKAKPGGKWHIRWGNQRAGLPATLAEADQMRAAIGAVQSALWATECTLDANKEWTADTAAEIAEALAVLGWGPRIARGGE